MFELGLEADHVPQRAESIVLAKLHHGVRFGARFIRVGEADRLHWPVTQRVRPAFGHYLDGQAALEIGRRRLEFLERSLLGREQCRKEGVVLALVEWAIDVVSATASWSCLV